jgi:hypothetical protein
MIHSPFVHLLSSTLRAIDSQASCEHGVIPLESATHYSTGDQGKLSRKARGSDPCNAEDLTQEFSTPLLSMSVRNRVNIIVVLHLVVITVPQFHCSQFRVEFYQSILIQALRWLTHSVSGSNCIAKATFADALCFKDVEPLAGRRPPTFRHRLPSLRLPLQMWQEESTLSTNRPRRRPQYLRMST